MYQCGMMDLFNYVISVEGRRGGSGGGGGTLLICCSINLNLYL